MIDLLSSIITNPYMIVGAYLFAVTLMMINEMKAK